MGSLPALTWTDVADIAVVSILAWAGIVWIRRSRARPALAGLAILGAVYLLARRLGLDLTASILQGFFAVLVLVLVVVFQDELRRIFERIGAMGLGRRPLAPVHGALDTVARTAGHLVERGLGGLVVLPGRDPLERHLEGGIVLDGRISEPLLLSLFDPHSPGHDGAVLLRGDRVDRFSVHLPLSANRARLGLRGTRHAAALGLAERTDALAVAVSEERGTISVALDGDLRTLADAAALADELRRFSERVAPVPAGRRPWRAFGVRWHEALAALAIGALAWLFDASALDPTRTVREAPVVVSNKAQWPSSYCWPEGFMRRWHEAAVWDHYIMVTPQVVQILAGVARNFVTNIHIGREFNMDGAVPRLGADVPRWYGETIGFWDGDTLITWTSNIQGWMVHAAFEYSNRMQTVEIYTPNRDANGNFLGLNHEAVFYDPEALVEPVRIIRNYVKTGDFQEAEPYVFIECVQTIFPIEGTATPVSPGQVIEYEVPDMYGRPWAHIWEKYWEQGMERPEEEDIFSFD